jgi:hypothetical protein
MTYTTEDLINILDGELRANWYGERVLLSPEKRLKDPVLAMALGQGQLSKVYAYREFRDQIHRYQLDHNISGLVWRECTFQGKTLRFRELHNQLIAIPADKEQLIAAKTAVLQFWHEATTGMQFWLARNHPEALTAAQVTALAQNAEWAEVEATRHELYLGLCWGNPTECRYQWAYPESGRDRIVASIDEPRSLKLLVSW